MGAEPAEVDPVFAEMDASTRGAVYRLFAEVVADGGGFPREPPATPEMFAEVWQAPTTLTRCATVDWTPKPGRQEVERCHDFAVRDRVPASGGSKGVTLSGAGLG